MLSDFTEKHEDLLRVEIAHLPKTGMFFGVCTDLRGMFVHGRTIDEMKTRIPKAIANSLQRMGYSNCNVVPVEDETHDDLSHELTVLRYRMQASRKTILH